MFLCLLAATMPFSLAKAQPTPGAQVASQPAQASDGGEAGFSIENSINMRDPFSRYVAKSEGEIAGETIPELERHELEQFKLVGIITGPKKNKALLTAPDGKMHVISEQVTIGTRHGVVTKIAPNEVIVHEKVVNLLGQEEGIDTAITFKEKGR